MLFKGQLTILLALVTCVTARFPSNTKQPAVSKDRYIVEVSNHSALALFGGSGQRRSFHDARAKRDIQFEVHKEYNATGIFVGVMIKLQEGENVSALSDMEGVVAVNPVRIYSVPKLSGKTLTESSDPIISDNNSTSVVHTITGVDKVHAQGITGSGIKVAIMDTGVDYRHPSLGSGFGPGFKVAKGYDFVGDNYNGSNTPMPDDDPLDTCNGHGTHVAGIVAMNPGNIYNVIGVAYNATLYAYRVLGCNGYGDTTVLMDGLIRANDDGADVINLSLGNALFGFPDDPLSVVASRIAQNGTVVVASAGNYGQAGPWLPSSPASGTDVIAVGSVDNPVMLIQNATVFINGTEGIPVSYYSLTPAVDVTTLFEMYATSTNTSVVGDACGPLPETTPDLSKKVVIIRGSRHCMFAQQCRNAAQFGANLFLFYGFNNQLGNLETGGFNAFNIRVDAAHYLVDNFAQGNNVTMSFGDRLAALQNTGTGGIISYFSSSGPSYEVGFKPEVCAPGGDIVSTWANNTFKIEQGTSMSSPYVAGSVALIMQARGKTNESASAIKDLLESTASLIASNLTGTQPPQTLILAGAGLIQVDRAINTTTLVSPGHLTLNDTAHFQPNQTFTVTNHGTEPMIYCLSHAPAGTLKTFNGSLAIIPPYTLTTGYATVEFSQTEFTVDPGQSTTITAKFTAPAIEEKDYPAYSGHIEITSHSETLSVSYLGVVGSVNEIQLLAHSDPSVNFSLPALQQPDGSSQNSTKTYTFIGDDIPNLIFNLAFGSPSILVDFVAANSSDSSDPKVVGTIQNATVLDRSRAGDPWAFSITENLADNTTLPDGEYQVLLTALRDFGSRNNSKDVETYLSPIIIKASANETATQP